ncbi:MAG: thioredoxin fold domain-containing protein [Chitinophagales bacterium]
MHLLASTNHEEVEDLDFLVGWEQACQMVDAMERPMFVYIYMDYKPECTQMSNQVFVDQRVKDFYKGEFVNLKINLHTKKGTYLKQKFQLRDFPALLYFDQKKKLITQDGGFKSVNEFVRIGKYALKSNDHISIAGVIPPLYTNYIEKKMQYENGVRNIKFLYDLAYELRKFNEPFLPVVSEYIEMEGVENLTKDRHLNFIYDFANEINSEPFDILLKQKQQYIDFLGEDVIDKRIKKTIRSAVIIAARYQNWEAFEQIKRTIERADISNQKNFEFLMLSVYHENNNNWTDFTKLIERYTLENPNIEASILNDLAWRYVVNIDDKSKIQKALSWSEKAIEKDSNEFKYRETYAALLYATGKKAKALKEAETAIIIARKFDLDYSTTLKLSEVIRGNRGIPRDLN